MTNSEQEDIKNNTISRDEFNHGAMLFITVLIILILITFFTFLCTRMQLDARLRGLRLTTTILNTTITNNNNTGDPFSTTMVNMGLDEATINGYPKLPYSQAQQAQAQSQAHEVYEGKGGSCCCCSICLGEYMDRDLVRILPDCGHWFHQKCVDAWLRMNSTCPLCRCSPLPTPLAEVAPLAASQL